MNVCFNMDDLREFLKLAAEVSEDHPVVISSFMQRCKEIEFDAVADEGKLIAYAISEHVEYAGVHSGDATIQFPPQKIYGVTAARIRKTAKALAEELHITGPFNIQFLANDNFIKVIECNLRASRSFPFVSKVMKINLIDLATRAMLGLKPEPVDQDAFDLDYVGIKASQFSFSRLNLADPVLGVDMVSTGEVGCIGDNFDEALLKSLLSVGYRIPHKTILVSSGNALQKADLLPCCQTFSSNGFTIYATSGTCRYLQENGVPAVRALWPSEEEEEGCQGVSALQLIRSKSVELVINIPKNFSQNELTNGYKLRRAAIDFNIPLITNSRLATAFVKAFCRVPLESISIRSWDEYK